MIMIISSLNYHFLLLILLKIIISITTMEDLLLLSI